MGHGRHELHNGSGSDVQLQLRRELPKQVPFPRFLQWWCGFCVKKRSDIHYQQTLRGLSVLDPLDFGGLADVLRGQRLGDLHRFFSRGLSLCWRARQRCWQKQPGTCRCRRRRRALTLWPCCPGPRCKNLDDFSPR